MSLQKYTVDLATRHIEQKFEKQDILSFVVNAKDPVTGTIVDFEELQLNGQTLPYGFIAICVDVVLLQKIQRRLHFRILVTLSSNIHRHFESCVKKFAKNLVLSMRLHMQESLLCRI